VKELAKIFRPGGSESRGQVRDRPAGEPGGQGVEDRVAERPQRGLVARGARPVIADVDRDSGNLTAETVKAAITGTMKSATRPRAMAAIP